MTTPRRGLGGGSRLAPGFGSRIYRRKPCKFTGFTLVEASVVKHRFPDFQVLVGHFVTAQHAPLCLFAPQIYSRGINSKKNPRTASGSPRIEPTTISHENLGAGVRIFIAVRGLWKWEPQGHTVTRRILGQHSGAIRKHTLRAKSCFEGPRHVCEHRPHIETLVPLPTYS